MGKKKLQELHLEPIDSYQGLKRKYIVFKSDTGEEVENCFVLLPDKDPAARAALRAYAKATENKTLGEDIINWVGCNSDSEQPLTCAAKPNYEEECRYLEKELKRYRKLCFLRDTEIIILTKEIRQICEIKDYNIEGD